MRMKKLFLRTLLVIFFGLDALALLQFHNHGWPITISGHSLGDGRIQVSSARVPVSVADWLIGTFLLAREGIVIYANWRVGRPTHRDY